MLRLITALLLTILSSVVYAQTQCTEIFSNVVATFDENDGDVTFFQNSRIINSDGTIDFRQDRIVHANGANSTCDNQLCVASGSFADELALPAFINTNSNTTVVVPQNSNNTATIESGEFGSVTVPQNESLTFTSVNGQYIIRTLTLGQGAVVNFAPGDYWINDLRMLQNSRIETDGSGLVRLFVTDVDDRQPNSRFISQNAMINPNQSSRNFLIVSYDDFRSSGLNVNVNAHLYAVDDVIVGDNSLFTGSIVLGDELVIQTNAQVTFDNESPRNLSFGDFCGAAQLVASYEFEESNPTVDTTNDNNGSLIGEAIDVRLDGATANQTCSVLDVPLNQSIGNNDGFETPVNVGEQLGDEGTISFWYRSDVQWNQGNGGLDRKLFDASLAFGNQNNNEDKFFFLVLQNNGSLLFGLEDEDDNNGLLVTARFNFDADEWVHIAVTWDVPNQQMTVFVNGVAAAVAFVENAISGSFSETSTLRLGDNRSSYLPNVGTTQNSGDGQFDSLRLYNFVQSTQGINDDRIASDVSNCGAPLDAISLYQFQPSEVPDDSLDFSDGNLIGNAVGVVLAGRPNVCGVLDVPLNTVAAPSDAFNTQVNIGETMGNRGTISFWYRSDEDWNLGGSGLDRKLFDASVPFGNQNDDEDKFFFLNLQSNGRLRFGFEDPSDNNTLLETGVLNFSANEWVHVAATWDVITQQATLFLNGSATGASFEEQNAVGQLSVTSTLFIGDNRSTYLPGVGTTPNSSNGQFDEVRLYRFAQTSAQVLADISAQPPGCFDDLLVNHYRLNFDTSFTCAASEVSVQACANNNCNTLSTVNSSLTLTSSANGSFDATNLTFVGSTVSDLSATTPGIVTIGAINTSPSADVRCFNNGVESASCGVDFAEVGLTVSFGDDQNIVEIPNGFSQAAFDSEIIVALDQSGVCDAELAGRTLEVAVQCNNPGSCNADQLQINDGQGNRTISNIEEFSATDFTFDANGQVTIPVNGLTYRDAGDIALSFRDSANVAIGTSNDFVMRPLLIAIANQGAQLVAGVPSSLIYEAVGTAGALTPNYDPSNLQIQLVKEFPLTLPDPSDPALVSHQGQMSFFGTDAADITTTDPVDATFVPIDENGFDFMGGVAGRSEDIMPEYSEVGTVGLLLRDENYLGTGITINAVSIGSGGLTVGPITLGSYIPAYFDLEVETPTLTNTCAAPLTSSPFTYIGQNLPLSGDFSFTVTAMNARGETTLNYGGNGLGESNSSNLWRLDINESDEVAPAERADEADFANTNLLRGIETNSLRIVSGTAATGIDGFITGVFDSGDSENNYDGEATYVGTLPVATHIKTVAPQAPNTASFIAQFGNQRDDNGTDDTLLDDILQLADADSVCFQANFPDGCSNIEGVIVEGSGDDIMLRYGRLLIDNAFGPETDDIVTPFTTEYFNDSGEFVLNIDDNCTVLDFVNDDFARSGPTVEINNLTNVIDDIEGVTSEGQLFNGRSLPFEGITVLTANVEGGLTISLVQQNLDVGQGWEEFLNFDWDGDGDIDANDMPSALVSFGIFRGNDRIIHWREVLE